MLLMQTPQIEPITTFARDHKKVLSKLKTGPVFLAQRSQPAAVLISIDQWDEIVKHIRRLEFVTKAERILAEANRDPSTVVSHAELKQKLAEKRANVDS